jgi:mRNA interferase RelE/StbE
LKWKIELSDNAISNLKTLDKIIQKRIIKFIKVRLETHENPRRIGSSLKGKLSGLWKYRIGDYRLICKIDDSIIEILVIHIGHRKNIYK